MSPVIKAFRVESSELRVKVCVTGQHRKMLDEVLQVFRIRADYDLNVMEEGQTLEHITREVTGRISPVFKKEKPDLILVHGDTSTTLLATLAAFYQRIPVGHVEAGLRSYDFAHPFPEEANRRLADALCALHFAPTLSAKKNLLRENIPAEKIFVTGNTVIDALQWAVSQPHQFQNTILRAFMESRFCHSRANGNPLIKRWIPASAGMTTNEDRIILVTAHRRENFGLPLINICSALKTIANSFASLRIIYPVHLNPNVQKVAKKILGAQSNIMLLPPLNYLDFACLMKRCTFVVTDSGGLQEEAPSLGKPVLVLRKVTERPEAVRAGTVKVIGTEKETIVREISKLITDQRRYQRMATAVNPYGDGQASERITEAILYYFARKKVKPKDFIPH